MLGSINTSMNMYSFLKSSPPKNDMFFQSGTDGVQDARSDSEEYSEVEFFKVAEG